MQAYVDMFSRSLALEYPFLSIPEPGACLRGHQDEQNPQVSPTEPPPALIAA